MTPTQRFVAARDFLQQHRLDYDTAYRDYRAPELDEFNWALDYFDVHAHGNDTTALWVVADDGSEQKVTYAAMAARSNQVANHLRELGVQRGDRVMLMLPNRIELWETMLAGIKLGAVLVPTTMLVSTADLVDRMDRGNVRHVIVQSSEAGKFVGVAGAYTKIAVGAPVAGWHDFAASNGAAPAFAPDGATLASDPLLLYFTSGTTAQPKLVLHSHQSYPVGHLSTMYWIGLQAGDVHWNISSPGWAKHAWSCFFAPWNAGATVFVYNYERFSAAGALGMIARCGVTSLCAPPTVWRMMIKEDLTGWKLPLRELVGAGEPLNPEVIEQVEKAWGIRIRDGFGQSETTAQIGNTPGQRLKPGSMGRPLPGVEAALVARGENGAPLVKHGEIVLLTEPDSVGELALRSGWPSMFRGYVHDEKRYRACFSGEWYLTGDLAKRDADGYYWYVGRVDDVIISAGHLISPFEVESSLAEHPAVADAGVIGTPDPVSGEAVKAYVLLRDGVTPTDELRHDILDFAEARLGAAVAPEALDFIEALPKSQNGKILRRLLKAKDLGLPTGDTSTVDGSTVADD